MSKFTPGPWHAGNSGMIVYDANGWAVANATTHHVRHGEDGMKANARLIAAAPELLEALEDLVSIADAAMKEVGDYDRDAELKDARAAIAKAKGEE